MPSLFANPFFPVPVRIRNQPHQELFCDTKVLLQVCTFSTQLEIFSLLGVCTEYRKAVTEIASKCFLHLSLKERKDCVEMLQKFSQKPFYSLQMMSINLEFCNNLTDDALQYFGMFPSITCVNLNACRRLTDKGIKYLVKNCPDLTSVSLYWDVELTNKSMTYLAECSNLSNMTYLNFSGVRPVTDEAFIPLITQCPNLTHLDITRMEKLTDASLVAISTHCHHLQTLLLYACANFTDKGLIAIAHGCRSLEKLDVCGSHSLLDPGVVAVAEHCTKLTWLNLQWCSKLTDVCLVSIGRYLHQLEKISIHGNVHVTEHGLAALANGCQRSLKVIDINGCKLIPDRSWDSVKKLFPALEVLMDL